MRKHRLPILLFAFAAIGILVIPKAVKAVRKADIGKNRLLVQIWSALWQKELSSEENVVKIKGWRSAIIDCGGYRRVATLIPEWVFWDDMWAHFTPISPFWKKINAIRRRVCKHCR